MVVVALLYVLLVLFIAVPDDVLAFQSAQQQIIIATPSQPTAAATVMQRSAGTSCFLAHSASRAGARGVRRMKVNMVFDFLRKRSEEGLAQVQNIATKTIQGGMPTLLSMTMPTVLPA